MSTAKNTATAAPNKRASQPFIDSVPHNLGDGATNEQDLRFNATSYELIHPDVAFFAAEVGPLASGLSVATWQKRLYKRLFTFAPGSFTQSKPQQAGGYFHWNYKINDVANRNIHLLYLVIDFVCECLKLNTFYKEGTHPFDNMRKELLINCHSVSSVMRYLEWKYSRSRNDPEYFLERLRAIDVRFDDASTDLALRIAIDLVFCASDLPLTTLAEYSDTLGQCYNALARNPYSFWLKREAENAETNKISIDEFLQGINYITKQNGGFFGVQDETEANEADEANWY